MRKKIIAIVGPTATGKSALAVILARKFGGEILSADSRQIYKGLDIGTGKITKKEMRNIPHHLIDIADPKKQFSVTDWKKEADKSLKSIFTQKYIPIVCGGTGFYIDTLLRGIVIPEVKPNKKLRQKLQTKNAHELFEILKKIDPKRAKTIDKNNPRRLVRAIEIAKTLGSVPALKKKRPPYNILWIGIDLPQKELEQKIHIRLKKRIQEGMLREASALKKRGLSLRRMKELGLEYKWLSYFLEKKIPKDEMLRGLEKDIIRYAKRQKTWFKKNPYIEWYSPNEKNTLREIEKNVAKFLTRT